tara:strand:+ start:217 stop:588 length:372 start_codon:yes stop_codon:yes gene_type:complete
MDKSPYTEMQAFVDAFASKDWEESAPTSVNRAKEQIAKCLLFFMKDIYNEVWYHGWNEPSQKKFDKAAQDMFNILSRFVKLGNLENQNFTKKMDEENPVDSLTFHEEELELGDIKTLKDYLVS